MSDYLSTPPIPVASSEDEAYQATWSTPGTFAGTSITYTIPGDWYVTLSSVTVAITTSAAAASRAAALVIADQSGTTIVTMPTAAAQGQLVTYFYSWSTGVSSGFTNGFDTLTAPIPRMVLIPGWEIIVRLSNIQAGDTASAVQFVGTRIPTAATPTGYVPAYESLVASPIVV